MTETSGPIGESSTACLTLADVRRMTSAALQLADVARLLGVDVRTVTRALENEQLPSIRVGRRILVPREPLIAMLSAPSAPDGAAEDAVA